MVSNKRYIFSILSIILVLSGCMNSKTPIERIYDVLENVSVKENGFKQQQNPMVSLERKEKAIYNQILEHGMKYDSQIVGLADKALALADERKVHIQKETNSLKKSEQEFKKMFSLKGDLKDSAQKKMADELIQIMLQRYKSHQLLYHEYLNGIKYDKQLYNMYRMKKLPFAELEVQVNKINKTYKIVSVENENFNQLTEAYNKKKLDFYRKAGLKLNK